MCRFLLIFSYPSEKPSILPVSPAFPANLWVQVLWDGVLFVWDSPTTLIRSQEGVAGRTGRNGGAQETPSLTRSTVSGT
ncbi:hypothetical protein U1Q18_034536 [Sarracenia purpurea var. burkii]